jgi:hypothetical protein
MSQTNTTDTASDTTNSVATGQPVKVQLPLKLDGKMYSLRSCATFSIEIESFQFFERFVYINSSMVYVMATINDIGKLIDGKHSFDTYEQVRLISILIILDHSVLVVFDAYVNLLN